MFYPLVSISGCTVTNTAQAVIRRPSKFRGSPFQSAQCKQSSPIPAYGEMPRVHCSVSLTSSHSPRHSSHQTCHWFYRLPVSTPKCSKVIVSGLAQQLSQQRKATRPHRSNRWAGGTLQRSKNTSGSRPLNCEVQPVHSRLSAGLSLVFSHQGPLAGARSSVWDSQKPGHHRLSAGLSLFFLIMGRWQVLGSPVSNSHLHGLSAGAEPTMA